MSQETKYTEDNIRSLDWKEHIRMRPGMYIGKLGDGSSADDGIYILVSIFCLPGKRSLEAFTQESPTGQVGANGDSFNFFKHSKRQIFDITNWKRRVCLQLHGIV